MQSSKPSKKSLKKEEERLGEVTPVTEAPKTRPTRSSKPATEKIEASSGKVHRKAPAAPPVRVNANEPVMAKVMTTGAGATAGNGGIIDSVGVVAAAPGTETHVASPAASSKPAFSREDIANLAYSYWEARGFTHGLADEDWIRAEAELLGRR